MTMWNMIHPTGKAVRNWSRSWISDTPKNWAQKEHGCVWPWTPAAHWAWTMPFNYSASWVDTLKSGAAFPSQANEAGAAAGLDVLYLAKGFVGSSHPHSRVIWKLPLKFMLFSAVTTCVSPWTDYAVLGFHFKFSGYKEMLSLCRVLNYSMLSGSWKKTHNLSLVIQKIMRPTFLICFKSQQQTNKENPNKKPHLPTKPKETYPLCRIQLPTLVAIFEQTNAM